MKFEITNEDKILFPKDRITKGELLHYYELIAPLILPLIKDHPLSLHRFPNGINKQGFFQKHVAEYFPDWIHRASFQKKEGGTVEMVVCQNKDTLLYLANQGCITPHLLLSTKQKMNKPDRIIFDLDPSGTDLSKVRKGALYLKQVLEEEYHLHPFLMTTGSKGYHIVVPIKTDCSFEEVSLFAKKIASTLCDHDPQFTLNPRKESRKGKIYIDYLRNACGQMAVAPYSVRPIDGAPIAMPIAWKELDHTKPQEYTLKNIEKKLAKSNPWKDFYKKAVSIKKSVHSLKNAA